MTLLRRWFWDAPLEMVNLRGFLAAFAVGIGLLLALAFGIDYAVSSRNCAYAQHRFHRSTHYDLFAGCYIQINGQESVPLDQYRAFRGVK